MTMPGLPPLPKSLSGFELAAAQQQLQYGLTAITEQAAAAARANGGGPGGVNVQGQQQQNDALQQGMSPLARKSSSTLDTQLSILRREMVCIILFIDSLEFYTIVGTRRRSKHGL